MALHTVSLASNHLEVIDCVTYDTYIHLKKIKNLFPQFVNCVLNMGVRLLYSLSLSSLQPIIFCSHFVAILSCHFSLIIIHVSFSLCCRFVLSLLLLYFQWACCIEQSALGRFNFVVNGAMQFHRSIRMKSERVLVNIHVKEWVLVLVCVCMWMKWSE